MATKAELEKELLELKKILAEQSRQSKNSDSRQEETEAPDDGADDEKVLDWEAEIADVVSHLEELPQKQPLLLALGAFAVGYLIGRAK